MYRDGKTWDRTERVTHNTRKITGTLELEEENNVEDDNFNEELEPLDQFINGSNSLELAFKIHAEGIHGKQLGTFFYKA